VLAVALALTASLVWGSSDWVGGMWTRRTSLSGVILVTQIAGLAFTAAFAAIRGHGLPGADVLLPGMLAGVASVVAIASFYKGLAIGIMSIVAPISATGVIVPVAVGLLRGDRPSLVQATGMGVAALGVLLASSERSAGKRPAPSRSSIGLALLAAFSIGVAYVGMDLAAVHDPAWGVFVLRCTSAVVFAAVLLTRRPSLNLTMAAIPILVIVGLGDNLANALFSLATTHGYLSVVAVLGYVYPAFTVVLAHLFSDERLARWQLVGIAAALGGAAAIAVG
jgi:drug/metabolite transporter (DMT)-like permease